MPILFGKRENERISPNVWQLIKGKVPSNNLSHAKCWNLHLFHTHKSKAGGASWYGTDDWQKQQSSFLSAVTGLMTSCDYCLLCQDHGNLADYLVLEEILSVWNHCLDDSNRCSSHPSTQIASQEQHEGCVVCGEMFSSLSLGECGCSVCIFCLHWSPWGMCWGCRALHLSLLWCKEREKLCQEYSKWNNI